jgi:hypothetical protein
VKPHGFGTCIPNLTIVRYTDRAIIAISKLRKYFYEICVEIEKKQPNGMVEKKLGFTCGMAKLFDIISDWLVFLLYCMPNYLQGTWRVKPRNDSTNSKPPHPPLQGTFSLGEKE